jgi:catechol 2,3-dioxygenase
VQAAVWIEHVGKTQQIVLVGAAAVVQDHEALGRAGRGSLAELECAHATIMMWSMQHLQGNLTPRSRSARPIDPGVRVGHVHLRTADIDRIRAFYVDVLGFDVVFEARDVPGWGTTGDILFLSAGGYHHHLGFNTWKSAGGPPQPDGVTGLHHVALNYPTRAALGDAVVRLREADWPLRQLADHGTHLAVYISDPDGNDLELAWDRPVEEWPRDEQGHAAMAIDDELDLEALVAAAR